MRRNIEIRHRTRLTIRAGNAIIGWKKTINASVLDVLLNNSPDCTPNVLISRLIRTLTKREGQRK